MSPGGEWRLAPAFDMTWAYGGRWASTHQMTLAEKVDGFTRNDLLSVGSRFDLPKDGAEILDEVDAALGLWESEAREAGIDESWVSNIQSLFRRLP